MYENLNISHHSSELRCSHTCPYSFTMNDISMALAHIKTNPKLRYFCTSGRNGYINVDVLMITIPQHMRKLHIFTQSTVLYKNLENLESELFARSFCTRSNELSDEIDGIWFWECRVSTRMLYTTWKHLYKNIGQDIHLGFSKAVRLKTRMSHKYPNRVKTYILVAEKSFALRLRMCSPPYFSTRVSCTCKAKHLDRFTLPFVHTNITTAAPYMANSAEIVLFEFPVIMVFVCTLCTHATSCLERSRPKLSSTLGTIASGCRVHLQVLLLIL